MSVDLVVFLERTKLPTLAAWATALSRAGFALDFPVAVDLARHTGFLPALLGEEESGFEFFISELDQDDADLPETVRSLALNAGLEVNLLCHGMQECLTATAAAAVLAEMADGVYFDPQSGEFLSGRDAVLRARTELDAVARKEAQDIAKGRKLPPGKWAEAFEQSVQHVNPEYRLSKEHRKHLIECTRQDAAGLHLSQNCVKINERYYHCFAVLLTSAHLSPVLYSPFVLGSRFDHNHTIAHAYNRDYRAGMKWQVAPREWHSEYRQTAKGSQQLVESTARSAEAHLYPLYMNRLAEGAERLVALFRDAALFMQEWDISDETLSAPVKEGRFTTEFAEAFHLRNPQIDWNDGLVKYYNALRIANAQGFSDRALLAHRQNAINKCDEIATGAKKFLSIPSELRSAAIFVRYVDDFLAVKEELPRMVAVIESLGHARSRTKQEPLNPVKPWWRFW